MTTLTNTKSWEIIVWDEYRLVNRNKLALRYLQVWAVHNRLKNPWNSRTSIKSPASNDREYSEAPQNTYDPFKKLLKY